MNKKIKKIVEEFQFDGNPIKILENNQGNINSTYMVILDNNQTKFVPINIELQKQVLAALEIDYE